MFQIFRKMGGGGHNKMELVEIPEISIKWEGGYTIVGGGGGGCFLHREYFIPPSNF